MLAARTRNAATFPADHDRVQPAEPAEKRKFVSSIYYIRDYAVTAGDGIPTLMRSTFDLAGGVLGHQAPVAMVEGIEGFRVEFGVDSLSETGGAIDYNAAVDWADPDRAHHPDQSRRRFAGRRIRSLLSAGRGGPARSTSSRT